MDQYHDEIIVVIVHVKLWIALLLILQTLVVMGYLRYERQSLLLVMVAQLITSFLDIESMTELE